MVVVDAWMRGRPDRAPRSRPEPRSHRLALPASHPDGRPSLREVAGGSEGFPAASARNAERPRDQGSSPVGRSLVGTPRGQSAIGYFTTFTRMVVSPITVSGPLPSYGSVACIRTGMIPGPSAGSMVSRYVTVRLAPGANGKPADLPLIA